MAVWSVLSVIATPFVYVLSDAASLFSDFNSHAINAMSLQAKEITGTICFSGLVIDLLISITNRH